LSRRPPWLRADTTDGIEKHGLAGCSSAFFGSIGGIVAFPEPVRASDGQYFPGFTQKDSRGLTAK
jgi:hypothetical protein